MTLSIGGTDIAAIAQGAAWAGSVVGMLIVGLIVYLMVRPPRHVRQRRKAERRGEIRPEMDAEEAETLWQVVDRMEARLDVLERALADQNERPAIGRRDTELEPTFMRVTDGRDSGRNE